jgi:hypothetical protein
MRFGYFFAGLAAFGLLHSTASAFQADFETEALHQTVFPEDL